MASCFLYNRRAFITLLGDAAAWPLAARAQQERMRRIGILMPYAVSNTEIQAHLLAFRQELQRLGWIEGRNIQFDKRWTGDDMDLIRANAASLLELKADLAAALVLVVLMTIQGIGYLLPTNFRVCLELQKDNPDNARIGALTNRYFFAVALQGVIKS